jgi:hypothetical protein
LSHHPGLPGEIMPGGREIFDNSKSNSSAPPPWKGLPWFCEKPIGNQSGWNLGSFRKNPDHQPLPTELASFRNELIGSQAVRNWVRSVKTRTTSRCRQNWLRSAMS